MKKLLVLTLMIGYIFTSCGKKEEAKTEGKDDGYSDYETTESEKAAEPEAEQAEAPAASSDDLIAQGQTLLNASDCKTCHSVENKIVGPAYNEVAKKYEFTKANVGMLADKVIKGGQGVWGEIPMAPHPDIKQEDAEKMAMYVLSLDGEKPKD